MIKPLAGLLCVTALGWAQYFPPSGGGGGGSGTVTSIATAAPITGGTVTTTGTIGLAGSDINSSGYVVGIDNTLLSGLSPAGLYWFTAGVPAVATSANVLSVISGSAQNISANGALSVPALTLSGTWITGGTGTTNMPQFKVEPSGTASGNWSTNGVGVGVNAPFGFTGHLFDGQVAGSEAFYVTYNAQISAHSIGATGSNIMFLIQNGINFTTSTAGEQILMGAGTISNSSGMMKGLLIQPTLQQTGTAGYIPLDVAPIVTTQGSGTQLLQAWHAGSAGTTLEASMDFNGNLIANSFTSGLYTVSSGTGNPALPACSSTNKGQQVTVTDALAPTYLGTLTGGSTTLTPVVCNGSAWVSF